MKYIKKYYFIIIIFLLCISRFLISYKLPSFALINLKYDDLLVLNQLDSLVNGNYLGAYSAFSLIKGPIFSIFLYYCKLLNISFSACLTIIYILSCIYFLYSIKKLIKNKVFLLFIFSVLLFNPVTYSGEVFQRLYINSISIIELMFFLGTVITIILSEEDITINYIILGTISLLMLLTRNDNIWIYIIIIFLIIYRLVKRFKIKRLIKVVIPLLIIIAGLNIVSYFNYIHYNIYTYNELEYSSFKEVYNKILQIKDTDKEDYISIPKSTFVKLAENSKKFGITKNEIENAYEKALKYEEKIDNGNVIWFFREIIYNKFKFKDGKEANKYFHNLSIEIDSLYKKGVFKKEISFPIIYLNIPTKNEIKRIPKNFINAIWYTTSYKNIKTYTKKELKKIKSGFFDEKHQNYCIAYNNYRHAEEMIKKNSFIYEIIRIIYKYLTIIFSLLAIYIYIKNIKKTDKLNIIIHLVLFIYIIILSGVVYTHVTAFFAIRYRYLANIYILQNLFILLNIYRMVGDKFDFSNNTSLQRRKNLKKNNH